MRLKLNCRFTSAHPWPSVCVGCGTSHGCYDRREGGPNTAKTTHIAFFPSLCAKTTHTYLFDEWEFLPGLLCSENALEWLIVHTKHKKGASVGTWEGFVLIAKKILKNEWCVFVVSSSFLKFESWLSPFRHTQFSIDFILHRPALFAGFVHF